MVSVKYLYSMPDGPLNSEIGLPLIGALLRMPVDRIRRTVVQALHDDGFDDITPAHTAVLKWPGPQGRRPVELAADAGMSKQAMNYLLGQLEALGYIERVVDPEDVRSRRVYATERGMSTVRTIRGAVTELERDWESRLGEDDWRELKRILRRLNEHVGDDVNTAQESRSAHTA